MKANGEYSATHSMSTAWFAIDKEGNVAIIEFEDNGPVPTVVPDSCEEEIVLELFCDSSPDEPYLEWRLNKEEVKSILENCRDYDYKGKGDPLLYVVAKIDMARFDEFKRAAGMFDKRYTVCLEKGSGLFYLDWLGDNDEENRMINGSIESGLITPYKYLSLWNDEKKTDVLSKYPFFVYRQPYYYEELIKRTVCPKKPFREERLPQSMREKAIRLPFLFNETKVLQIAEYVLTTDNFSHAVLIDGHQYSLLPVPGGKKAYLALSSIYYAGCGKSCRACFRRGDKCHYCYEYQTGRYPTVAVIVDLQSISYDDKYAFGDKAVFLPIIQGIPSMKESLWEKEERELSNFPIEKMFSHCHENLERNIDFFKPRVILIKASVLEYLKRYYPMHDGRITIGELDYPYFLLEERVARTKEIEDYLRMPYRGGTISFVIPEKGIDKSKVVELPQSYF